MIVIEIISWLFLIAGSFFGLSGAFGLFKFSDFFTRVHAASVTDSQAAGFIITGLILQTDFDLVAVKLVFILIFLLLTSPTASHALAKSARHGGLLSIPEAAEKKAKEAAAEKQGTN